MYICINSKCDKYNVEQNPGGRIIIKDDKPHYTGSVCKYCKDEMKEVKTGAPNFSVINYGDGRYL